MEVIFFVANLSNLRGMENQAILQYDYLKRNLYNIKLWTLSLPKTKKNNYIQIVYTFLKPKIVFSFLFIFLNTIFIRKKTIVHIHGLSEYALPFLLVKAFNKNIYVILKISNSGKKSSFKKIKNKFPLLGDFIIKLFVLSINKWICINRQIKKETLNHGVPNNKLCYLPNGVELIYKEKKRKNKINNLIIWAGSLVDHKNIKFALEIIEKLPRSYKLLVYGSGPLYNEVLSYIHLKGLKENVILKGWVTKQKLLLEMQHSTIYLSTSKAEGISNALLEAISNGLIPVCANIPANQEVLGKNYKFLQDDFDVNKWVYSIKNLKNEYYKQSNYLEKKIKKYDINNITNQILKIYQD